MEKAGFESPEVGCPRHGGNAVIVRYDSGPDLASPGVADQIAQVVWSRVPYRFDLLAIESRGTKVAFSGADLAQRFGPRALYIDSSTVEDQCGATFGTIDIDGRKGPIVGAALALIVLALLFVTLLVIWVLVRMPEAIAKRWRARRSPSKRK